MFTAIIVLVFVVLAGDAIYARWRLALRRRAVAQSPPPAWELSSPSSGGWHPLGEKRPAADSPQAEGTDLSRLFGGRRS
jgi:hypothetical protein